MVHKVVKFCHSSLYSLRIQNNILNFVLMNSIGFVKHKYTIIE